jgi:hypothetical protein
LNALAVRPEALGFYRGGSPDATSCKHYQGIVRVEAADGTPYFIVTRSGNVPDISEEPLSGSYCTVTELGENNPGNLLIVKMESRDKNGERLRSNRLQRDTDIADTAPPLGDTTVTNRST